MNKFHKYILLICGIIFILRIPGLYQPILNIDESVFSEFANIILEGGIPYIDAIDNKPPFTYYFFSLIYFIFGKNNLIGVHLATTLVVMITAIMVFLTGKEIRDEKTGLIAAIIFTALAHTYEPKYISTSGETLINLPIVLSSYIFIKYRNLNKKNFFLYLIAGLSLGTAFLINYKAGILAIVFTIQALIVNGLLTRNDNRLQSTLKEFTRLSIMGIGALIPIVIIILYFFMLKNLNDFYFWSLSYNFSYIKSGLQALPLWKPVARISYFILCSIPAWIVSIIYIMKRFSWRTGNQSGEKPGIEQKTFIFIILWLAFSFYAATLGGRTYDHYFIQIIVPLSILSGTAYYTIIEKRNKWFTAFWIYFSVFIVVLSISRININFTYKLINYPQRNAFISYEKAGKYINKNSSPRDKIFVWGWATPIYYYANRRCSAKFLIADYISGRVFGTPDNSKIIRTDLSGRVWKDFITVFKNNPPDFFVDTSPGDFFGYSRFPIKNYPELFELISKKYVVLETINKIIIYKKCGAGSKNKRIY